jgi:integrase
MQSEVLSLERRQVDLEAGALRLDPGTTKNGEGRTVYLTPELKVLLGAQLERVDRLSKRTKTINPYVFPHLGGVRRLGQRVEISGKLGRRPVGRPGCQASCDTIFAEQQYGTW